MLTDTVDFTLFTKFNDSVNDLALAGHRVPCI